MAQSNIVPELPEISEKRRIERHYFNQFKDNYPLPSGTVDFGDKPDVIISGARRIGIEVTNFFVTDGRRADSVQRQRERRNAVVAEAQRLFQRATDRKRGFFLGFDDEYPIGSKRAQQELARRIADMALAVTGDDNGQISNGQFEDIPELSFAYMIGHRLECPPFDDPQFPDGPPADFGEFVKYQNRQDMHARRHGIRRPVEAFPEWRVMQVYSSGLMSVERLRELVRAKEEKAAQYRKCDAYWLLVVVDFIDPAQEQEIRVDDFSKVRSEVFEKIIVYRTGFEHILEIA